MNPIRSIPWPAPDPEHVDQALGQEWLVTNGLGGYASGTLLGVPTRRYHGLLIASLAAPFGRSNLLNHLTEIVRFPDGSTLELGGIEHGDGNLALDGYRFLAEFRLEAGLPVWRYEIGDFVLEKRVLMPHGQNTVQVTFTLLSGTGDVRLEIAPAMHFRTHDAPVSEVLDAPYRVSATGPNVEISDSSSMPPLRFMPYGRNASLLLHGGKTVEIFYRTEARRGYDAVGRLWTPGHFLLDLSKEDQATLVVSTEVWDAILALPPADAIASEYERRGMAILTSCPEAQTEIACELVLAADQFLIAPAGRTEDAARAHATGEELRTVIAGYHWFTDWGRDTMISLEGLTLATRRHMEARWILRTFAHYIRDGLVPNMFPEGENEGLYHTADATLWFFHAVDRYLHDTSDRDLLKFILPKLVDVVDHHLRGTRFGICVDADDGLLRQGAEGYQLTWMDAKVDNWVVTPRRGKAVEINALWYNALRLLERWLRDESQSAPWDAGELADRVYDSFNRRFWYEKGKFLYDIVDGERGDDPACRPNQLLAISLPHPVLEASHWVAVIETVRARLLTPVGLRSLAPGHPDYKPCYDGDLRARDAAYHQGTVWGWLIGRFVDAWLKVYPEEVEKARGFLAGFVPHLNDACVGSMSEVFDAEPPFLPRGCIAQAWTVAEVLRAWLKTQSRKD